MPQFRYRAARPDGTVVEDSVDSDSELAARSQLEGRGLLIFSLRGSGVAASLARAQWNFGHLGRFSLREFLVFNQEFLALVKAGLPVLKTFDLLADRVVHPGFQAALRSVRTNIHAGASISEAMAGFPSYFSELYRASLRSGEQTGNLVQVLQRHIAYLKLVIGVREKVVKAMAYPAFLIVVGIAVVAFLLVYVMPTFAEIYGQNRTQLPGPTRMLLAAIESAQLWFPWVLGGTVGLAAVVYQWAKSPGGRERLDRFSLHMPILGDVLLKSQIIRLSRTLATVLAGGIPLTSALQITSGATTNRMVSKAISRATDRVKEGLGLAASLKEEAFLPKMTLEMIEVGEATGSLETMLEDVAEFHEGELDLRLNQLTTWIEPVLLLVMGVLVGGIVIIMYLPVFQIAGAV